MKETSGNPVTCKKKKSRVQANSMLRIASSWPNSEKAQAVQLWNQLLKAKDNLKKSVTWQRLLIQSLIHIFPLYLYHTDDYSAHIFIPRVNVFDIFFPRGDFLVVNLTFKKMRYLNIYFDCWVLESSPQFSPQLLHLGPGLVHTRL